MNGFNSSYSEEGTGKRIGIPAEDQAYLDSIIGKDVVFTVDKSEAAFHVLRKEARKVAIKDAFFASTPSGIRAFVVNGFGVYVASRHSRGQNSYPGIAELISSRGGIKQLVRLFCLKTVVTNSSEIFVIPES